MQIDLWKYAKIYEQRLESGVNEWLKILEKSIEEKSPLDTGEYIDWNKKTEATKYWNKIVWRVYNDCDYAKNVEYWFRSTPVNWHKNRRLWWPIIHTGIGARTYSRTYDEKRDSVMNILKNKLKKW